MVPSASLLSFYSPGCPFRLPPSSHYSPPPQECLAGTRSLATQLTAADSCTPCPAGKYCQDAGMTTVTGNCLAGYFCNSGQLRGHRVLGCR